MNVVLTWIPAPPEGSLPPIVSTAGKDMLLDQGADEHVHLYPFGPPTEKHRDNDKVEPLQMKLPDSPRKVLTTPHPKPLLHPKVALDVGGLAGSRRKLPSRELMYNLIRLEADIYGSGYKYI